MEILAPGIERQNALCSTKIPEAAVIPTHDHVEIEAPVLAQLRGLILVNVFCLAPSIPDQNEATTGVLCQLLMLVAWRNVRF